MLTNPFVSTTGEQNQMGAAVTQFNVNTSSHQEAFVEAPEWMHGCLIGQKGANIKEIQDKFGNDKIKEILEATSLKDDLLTSFRMFFAFPTLYMFHKLLCDFYHKKDFDEENYKQLINFAKTNY